MEPLLTTDACTMPTAERPLRLAEFDALFATAVDGVERDTATVRLHLSGASGLAEWGRNLTDRETACCSFFDFFVTGTDDDLTIHITAPPARQDILDALAERAEELSA